MFDSPATKMASLGHAPKKALSTAELKPNTAYLKRRAMVSALRNRAEAPPQQQVFRQAGYEGE